MITESEYKSLEREVQSAQNEAERAKGAIDQLMSQLQNEFGCSSVREAKKLNDKLTDEEATAKKQFEKAFSDYQKKWGGSNNESDE